MTPLFDSIMSHHVGDTKMLALSHKVWDPTPWVIDVFTGSYNTDEGMGRRHDMSDFCVAHFGKESWPIHDKPADWHWGGATVDGWSWIGFKTEAMMQQFLTAFPQELPPWKNP